MTDEGVPCRVRWGSSLVARGIAIPTAAIASFVFLIGLIGARAGHSDPTHVVEKAFALSALFAAPALALLYRARTKAARVVAEPGILRIVDGNRERRVAVADVETDIDRGRKELVLGLRGGRSVTITLDRGTTAVLRSECGLDPELRALAAPLRGTLGAFTLGLIGFLVGCIAFGYAIVPLAGPWGIPGAIGCAIVVAVLIVRRWGSPRVIVGADGIRVSGDGTPTFVSFADVTAVDSHSSWAIDVTKRNRERLSLPTVGQSDAQVKALIQRIRSGVARHHAAVSEPVHVLERNGRDLARWRSELARAFAGGSSFREQALSRDVLERVLGDAKAPPERRLGAAMALRVAEESARARIRIAADTCADESLKQAFDEIANDELEEATLARLRKR
ncbi:hypothetical protein BH09MYX1_BH09MYX1_12870 [soil metagenome]